MENRPPTPGTLAGAAEGVREDADEGVAALGHLLTDRSSRMASPSAGMSAGDVGKMATRPVSAQQSQKIREPI